MNKDLATPMTESSYWNTADRATGWIQIINEYAVPLHMIRLGKGSATTTDRLAGVDINASWTSNTIRAYTDAIPMYYWRLDNPDVLTPQQQADRMVEALGTVPATHMPLVVDFEEPMTTVPQYLLETLACLQLFGVRDLALYTRTNILNGLADLHLGWMPLGLAHYVDAKMNPEINPWAWDEHAYHNQPATLALPASHSRAAWWQFQGDGNGLGRGLGFSSDDVPVNLVADWWLRDRGIA